MEKEKKITCLVNVLHFADQKHFLAKLAISEKPKYKHVSDN